MMKTRTTIKIDRSNRLVSFFAYVALSISILLSLSISFAHQQKTSVTRILFNPRTENIEIMHRFVVHDAEHAAGLIFGERQTLMESEESRELFSSYVRNRFAIQASYASGPAQELSLSYVGQEIDGQYLWVYQELQDDPAIIGLTIVNLALRDVWPDQSNLVNIEHEGEIHSLTFDGPEEVLSIML